MELLLLFLLLLLYVKWILIILTYPIICLYFHYIKYHGNLFMKLLGVPGYFLDKWAKEGFSRLIIINIGYIPSVYFRKLLYRLLGVTMGKDVVFHYKTEIRCPIKLKVGKGSIIGDNALLDARNGLTIGSNVNFSSNVSIYTEQHDYRNPFFECNGEVEKSVKIEDRVWIGSNVVVLPGVKIGEGAVCCSGCVITKDVAPFNVVAGIPAKKVNTRPQNLQYEFDGSSCWFY